MKQTGLFIVCCFSFWAVLALTPDPLPPRIPTGCIWNKANPSTGGVTMGVSRIREDLTEGSPDISDAPPAYKLEPCSNYWAHADAPYMRDLCNPCVSCHCSLSFETAMCWTANGQYVTWPGDADTITFRNENCNHWLAQEF